MIKMNMLASHKLYLLFFSLYWAQGLPVGFMTHALPVILRYQGVSLTQIGGFGLLMAPWALKVLWAPYVDRFGYARFGHYRGWILVTQWSTVIILVVLSFLPIQALNQPLYLLLFFITLLAMNVVGATQDIATDALAVHVLQGEQQHWGNMFQVVGSRLGFIVGGGAILWAMDALTWQTTFLILASLVGINTVPILRYRELKHHALNRRTTALRQHDQKAQTFRKPTLQQRLKTYCNHFLISKQMRYWFLILCTIKITDGLSGPIIKPLLVDMGLSLSQIGVYITMLGALAALCGAFIASCLLHYMQRRHALLLFSVLKLLSLLAFVWVAHLFANNVGVQPWILYTIHALEDFFSAMLLVVILTLVMQYSRKTHAGADFTFQVSIMALLSGVLYTLSGIVGDILGYESYLILIFVIGVFCLIPVWLWQQSQSINLS